MHIMRRGSHDPPSHPPRARGQRGIALLEVALAGAILAFALVGVASSFGTNASAVDEARDLTRAGRFLEEVLDSISAQPYDNLPLLNGNTLYDRSSQSKAIYRIQVAVSEADVDLLKLRLVLSHIRSGNEVTRLVTYRSRR